MSVMHVGGGVALDWVASHLAATTSPQLSMGGFFLRGIFGVED